MIKRFFKRNVLGNKLFLQNPLTFSSCIKVLVLNGLGMLNFFWLFNVVLLHHLFLIKLLFCLDWLVYLDINDLESIWLLLSFSYEVLSCWVLKVMKTLSADFLVFMYLSRAHLLNFCIIIFFLLWLVSSERLRWGGIKQWCWQSLFICNVKVFAKCDRSIVAFVLK